MKFLPNFYENKETKGIIGTDYMDLNVEMPDKYKLWLKTPATNKANTGVSFQASNVNKFVDGNWRIDTTWTFTLQGHTYAGAAGNLSPACHWAPCCSGVDALATNKLINRLTFNIQNKNWSEEQRIPELFDVEATQFSKKALENHGIMPFMNQGQIRLDRMLGRGLTTRTEMAAATVDYKNVGVENGLPPVKSGLNSMELAYEKGYITYTTQFSQVNGVQLQTITNDEFPYQLVPSTDGTTVVYTNGSSELIQVVTLTIHEYIISPSLSNPYAKNPYSKTFYTGNYPVNLTCDFNSTYLENCMFKTMLWSFYAGSTLYGPVITAQPTITDANLYYYTFDTNKQLSHNYQRCLYYFLDFQTMQNKLVNPTETIMQTSEITTANLSSLPPFIGGWVSMRSYDNKAIVPLLNVGTDTVQTIQNLATYQFQDLDHIEISYGSQTDCMLGTNVTWREIVDLTMDVVGNPEYRDMILGSMGLDEAESPFNHSFAGVGLANIGPGGNFDVFWKKNILRQGMKFFLLPTNKLNWRPIANTALIPEFNYGSNNFKSLQVKYYWLPAKNLASEIKIVLQTPAPVTYQPVLFLAQKRVRSIPMDGQGPSFDEKLEFDMITNEVELQKRLSEFNIKNSSAYDVNDELQFVGGAFFGDILNKVRRALPTISNVVHSVHHATQGKSGLLGDINRYTGLASKGLSHIGYGKSVGRPRKY